MVKKPEQITIKNFSRVNQLMDFFPARNLKAESFVVKYGKYLGAHRTLSGPEVVGVLQGIAQIVIDGEVYQLKKDEMIFIPRGKLCNIFNYHKTLLNLLVIVPKSFVV